MPRGVSGSPQSREVSLKLQRPRGNKRHCCVDWTGLTSLSSFVAASSHYQTYHTINHTVPFLSFFLLRCGVYHGRPVTVGVMPRPAPSHARIRRQSRRREGDERRGETPQRPTAFSGASRVPPLSDSLSDADAVQRSRSRLMIIIVRRASWRRLGWLSASAAGWLAFFPGPFVSDMNITQCNSRP